MKFVHMADMHFDSPFRTLSNLGDGGDVRRLEQRKVFKKIIDYIKENAIEYLLIAGDFYEHDYIRNSTIEYINRLFAEIPQTKIFITPGNHDPYLKGSYYERFTWHENVHICKNKWEIVHEPACDIYMTAFTDFFENESPLNDIKIENPNKINILLTHCDLNGTKDKNGFSYNPILESKLNAMHFDFVAMGHIHKNNFGKNGKNIYPGSTISFGFDELGQHGIIAGEIHPENLTLNFIKLDDRIFTKCELSVDNIFSQEDLIEYISEMKFDKNTMYEIILVGNRNFEINCREVLKLIDVKNVLKIKDETLIGMDIEEISKESSLRGIFVREVMQKYSQGNYTEEQIKKAIEIGLSIMS